jgi:hypothetical protein
MTINGTKIEDICKFLLQKNISLELKNKQFKNGKLVIFNQKNFYINFVLENDKKTHEKIELPIPYDIEFYQEENLIYFDYRLKCLYKFSPEIETNLIFYPKKVAGNKFWDTILTINANK